MSPTHGLHLVFPLDSIDCAAFYCILILILNSLFSSLHVIIYSYAYLS